MSIIDGTSGPAVRRYRILGMMAEGGYGRVYRARLEVADGFSKDVAIKLMRPGLGEADIARFRDEIRILGRVRDRAIVSVQPPTWLDGRPALVMEFADGRSAGRLLQETGAFPPTVALEIVEEVARALDVVYQQPGPDGRPLRLVHRDLKPANLQISPSGAVRILDFGIASAEVPREAVAGGLVGTAPYVAPERRRGIEGPEGDIWSLGVTLRTLATGQAPDVNGRVPMQDLVVGSAAGGGSRWVAPPGAPSPELVDVLRIADLMTDPDPDHRLRPRRVEDLCRDLRRRLDGPSLRQWATLHVQPALGAAEDPLVGQILTEVGPAAPPSIPRAAVVVVAVLALVAATFGVGAWFSLPSSDGPVLAGVADRAAHGVTFTSSPPGASVTIDGIPSGTTPLDAELLPGVHEVRLWASGQEIERQILVGSTSPRRYAWDGGETWKILY